MSYSVKHLSLWAGTVTLAVLLLILPFLMGNDREPTTISNSHFGSVTSIEILPNDIHFVSSAFDYKVKVWNLKDQKHIKTNDSNLRVVMDFATSKSRNIIYGVGTEGTFYMWDADSFELIRTFDPLYFPVEEIILSENESYLAAKTADTVIIFELMGETELSTPRFLDQGRHKQVQDLLFRNKQLISAGSEGHLFYWEYETGRLIETIETGLELQKFELSADGKKAFIGSADVSNPDSSIIELWNLEEKNKERTLGKCKGNVLDILTVRSNETVVVSCSESPLMVFQIKRDEVMVEMEDKFKPGLRDLTYSESQDALIYRYADNIEIIWNFKSSF